ncbi:hypothetical protein [Tychonema sp. BBK16]|uniref:hypothetical protein n=1 Tax=Tychonema sp. BBK16 TaxID=2699888 RepID=UPI001F4779E1|nr:hypothetical protein [Tychonema sp. BBK16]MCF6371464.1 hypothetical protein [Tychonema sp. BBK16]
MGGSKISQKTECKLFYTPALQARMSALLDRNKSGNLSRLEEVELDRYLLLEHWVRLAKAHAYKRSQTVA